LCIDELSVDVSHGTSSRDGLTESFNSLLRFPVIRPVRSLLGACSVNYLMEKEIAATDRS